MATPVLFHCSYCTEKFPRKWNKVRHERRVHGKNSDSDSDSDGDEPSRGRMTIDEARAAHRLCEHCKKIFSTTSNRRAHELRIHGMKASAEQYAPDATSIICRTCQVSFKSLNVYREHLRQTHNIETKKVNLTFASLEEFRVWKDTMELDVGVNYTAHFGSRKVGGGVKTIFYCRRSGTARRLGDISNMKRATKSQGTSKLGYHCTSSLEAVKKSDKIYVTLYPDHRDHDLGFSSLSHMNLPRTVKDKIAGMIIQGMEHEKILEQVRAASPGDRTSILEKRDLESICASYGLTKSRGRHPNDIISVGLIVKEMQDVGEVLYFKDQGDEDVNYPEISSEEFVLGFMKDGQEVVLSNQLKNSENLQVCMDSAHCINQYAGFHLTTLMTVTDLHRGFPIAFLISSTVDTDIIKVFLIKLRERVGIIGARFFMTEDDPLLRNAWESIMSTETPVTYLNCNWHTDRTFRKSIVSKIVAPINEKVQIYEMVKDIMDEPEEEMFHDKCDEFLNYLSEADFKDFHDYFLEMFLCENSIRLWPQCFREGAILNTNTHIKSMHNLLKYVYLKGEKITRLDDTLLGLHKMVEEKLFKRMVDLMKNRTGKQFSERHRKGMNLEVRQDDEGVFTVGSDTCKDHQYQVEELNLTCEDCKDRCSYCRVCKCMYSCKCEDNAEGTKNICEHIHAVAIFLKNKCQPVELKPRTEEIEMIHNIVSTSSKKSTELQPETLRAKLSNVWSQILEPLLDEVDDIEVLKTVDEQLSKTIGTLKASIRYPGNTGMLSQDVSSVSEPGKKYCVKQDASSTKRKRQEEEGRNMKKPSARGRRKIKNC